MKARPSGGGPAGIAAVPPAPPSPASTPPGTLAPTAVPGPDPSAAKPPAPTPPIEAPQALHEEMRDDGARQSALRSVATGVAGGVEGGVPGGIVGGVVGGVPNSPVARQELMFKLQSVRPEFDTEAYDRIADNPFLPRRRRPALDLLDRRRHRLLRQRPPLPDAGPAAAEGRGAHRGAAQLLPLRLPAAERRTRRSRSRPRSRGARGRPEHRLARIGLQAAGRSTETGAAAAQPRLPARRVGLDGAARTSCRC